MGKMPFPSSASLFASVTVVLRCLGEQIRSQRLLYNLALVNKLFNAEFSPFLYLDVRIQSNRRLRSLLSSAYLARIKRLAIRGEIGHKEANELVQQLLANTPNLESFKWIGIPLATATVVTLQQSCKKIKSIHIDYPVSMDYEVLGYRVWHQPSIGNDCDIRDAREIYSTQDFTAFKDLKELTIDNIGKNLHGWRRQLVMILKNSPHLQKLGLSISVDTISRAYHRENYEKYKGFFDSVCEEYVASGGSPLHLQILNCGTAMYPQNSASLQMLTDLSYLEEVHIENGDVVDPYFVESDSIYDDILIYQEENNIVFDAILSPRSLSLRRFTAYTFCGHAYMALYDFRAVGLTRKLAISFDYDDFKILQLLREDLLEDQEQPFLPMQFRMIDLNLRGDVDTESAQQILDDLVSTNSETLEGIMVQLPKNLAIDSGFDYLEELQGALQEMPNLTQLVIAEMWSSRLTEEMHKCVAQKLANAVPQLRYINVHKKFWRILYGIDSDGEETRILEELDEREQEDVELFRNTICKY